MASISFLVSFISSLFPPHLQKPVLISKSQSSKAVLHYLLGGSLPPCHTCPPCPLCPLRPSPPFSPSAFSSSALPEGTRGYFSSSESYTLPSTLSEWILSWDGDERAKYILTICFAFADFLTPMSQANGLSEKTLQNPAAPGRTAESQGSRGPYPAEFILPHPNNRDYYHLWVGRTSEYQGTGLQAGTGPGAKDPVGAALSQATA